MSGFVCTREDMHPFECGGSAESCIHCARRKTERHDPATCELCDQAYDFEPNPYREAAEKP